MAHFLKIKLKLPAEHLGIGKADSRDSKAIHHPWQGCIACSLNGFNQVVIGFLPKAFHLHNRILMFLQMEDICIFMDETRAYELLQGGF